MIRTLGIGTPAAIDISSTTLKSCGASSLSISRASAMALTRRLPKASDSTLQPMLADRHRAGGGQRRRLTAATSSVASLCSTQPIR